MPHNKNTDRTRRFLLRWIAGASFLVMAIYLFFPHIFGEEFADQVAHDTPADPLADSLENALPPEIIDLPADAPELPSLIPPFLQDEELMVALANEYNLLTLPWLAGKRAPLAKDEAFTLPAAEQPAPAEPADIPAIAQAPHDIAIPADTADSEKPLSSLAHLNARDLTRDNTSSAADVSTPPPCSCRAFIY